jgi:hypothetical protein
MSVVHIPHVYRYRSEAEIAAEAAQPPRTVAAEAQEEPAIDLDTALNRLDAALATLDELIGTDQRLPAELDSIEKRREALTDQQLDSVEGIMSRSSEMAKLCAMAELGQIRQKKLKSAITAQEAVVLKIGGQAASLAEQLWWDLRTKAHAEAETEFSRLFFHAYEHPDILNKFRPVVLLDWLRPPDFRTGATSTKIVRARGLRTSLDRLKEFSGMSFEEISAELEAQDREARERAQQVRQIGSELSRGN